MKRTIGLSALGILLLALMFGCTFGMTLEERIAQFASDLTLADRTNTYLNFHSTQTLDYDVIKPATFWETPFPLSTPADPLTYYTITILDATNPMAVTAEISSTAIGLSSPYSAIFSMAYEGFDYKIVTLQADLGAGWDYVVD